MSTKTAIELGSMFDNKVIEALAALENPDPIGTIAYLGQSPVFLVSASYGVDKILVMSINHIPDNLVAFLLAKGSRLGNATLSATYFSDEVTGDDQDEFVSAWLAWLGISFHIADLPEMVSIDNRVEGLDYKPNFTFEDSWDVSHKLELIRHPAPTNSGYGRGQPKVARISVTIEFNQTALLAALTNKLNDESDIAFFNGNITLEK